MDVDVTGRHPATRQLLRWFEYDHLPPHLRDVSSIYAAAAWSTVAAVQDGPELSAGLRSLLVAKDCAVRQRIADLDDGDDTARLQELAAQVRRDQAAAAADDGSAPAGDDASTEVLDDASRVATSDRSAAEQSHGKHEAPETRPLCRSCGRPFSPTHDAAAPGMTTRHPFQPATSGTAPADVPRMTAPDDQPHAAAPSDLAPQPTGPQFTVTVGEPTRPAEVGERIAAELEHQQRTAGRRPLA